MVGRGQRGQLYRSHRHDHLALDESLRKNISMGYYEAGHMMYVHMPSLKQMKKDLSKFIKDAS